MSLFLSVQIGCMLEKENSEFGLKSLFGLKSEFLQFECHMDISWVLVCAQLAESLQSLDVPHLAYRGTISFMFIPCSNDRKRLDSVFYFLVSDQSQGFSSEATQKT